MARSVTFNGATRGQTMRRSAKPRVKKEDVVKLTVTLKTGAEFELVGSRIESGAFHHRFKKYVDGQVHKTDNHRILSFGGTYFHADSVAAYSAEDMNGEKVDLGALN
jgi:hypothetical protein